MAKSTLASGQGRILIAVYSIFALAALGRASYELIAKFSEAPLAYSFSAIAAALYIFAVIALIRDYKKGAKFAIYLELALVVLIGILSLLNPAEFEGKTIWSQFGLHYGLIPLLLPLWGVWWLRRA